MNLISSHSLVYPDSNQFTIKDVYNNNTFSSKSSIRNIMQRDICSGLIRITGKYRATHHSGRYIYSYAKNNPNSSNDNTLTNIPDAYSKFILPSYPFTIKDFIAFNKTNGIPVSKTSANVYCNIMLLIGKIKRIDNKPVSTKNMVFIKCE